MLCVNFEMCASAVYNHIKYDAASDLVLVVCHPDVINDYRKFSELFNRLFLNTGNSANDNTHTRDAE